MNRHQAYQRPEKTISDKQLTYTSEIETVISKDHRLYHILECINFWNKEGLYCHQNYNPNFNKGELYEDFILRGIAADCYAFVKEYNEYLTGKGGNHVWLARASDGQRILIINF